MQQNEAFDLDLSLSLDMNLDLSMEADEADPDPLADVPKTDSIEVDSLAEMNALKSAFGRDGRSFKDIAREKRQREDSEYWFCVVFQSREQKEEFLRNSGLIADGDKYINGVAAAEKLGVALTPASMKPAGLCKIDRKLAAIAR